MAKTVIVAAVVGVVGVLGGRWTKADRPPVPFVPEDITVRVHYPDQPGLHTSKLRVVRFQGDMSTQVDYGTVPDGLETWQVTCTAPGGMYGFICVPRD